MWGEREIIYLSVHCHHHNDFCIKMGSDESHFDVSLTVRDKVTRQCPQTTTFEDKGEPRNVLWCQVHSSHIHSSYKTFNYNRWNVLKTTFRNHSRREHASIGCDDEKCDLLYSAGQHRKLR